MGSKAYSLTTSDPDTLYFLPEDEVDGVIIAGTGPSSVVDVEYNTIDGGAFEVVNNALLVLQSAVSNMDGIAQESIGVAQSSVGEVVDVVVPPGRDIPMLIALSVVGVAAMLMIGRVWGK